MTHRILSVSPKENKNLDGLVILTIRYNSLFKLGHINVIVAKVIILFNIPIGDIRLYVPNLSKRNLQNCTVPRPADNNDNSVK